MPPPEWHNICQLVQVFSITTSMFLGKWLLDLWADRRGRDAPDSDVFIYHLLALGIRMLLISSLSLVLYLKGLGEYALDSAMFVTLVGLDAVVVTLSSIARARTQREVGSGYAQPRKEASAV